MDLIWTWVDQSLLLPGESPLTGALIFPVDHIARDGTPTSLWTATTRLDKLPGPKKALQCGVEGCNEPNVRAVHCPVAKTVQINMHWCNMRKSYHFVPAMVLWTAKFQATARFVSRRCPMCKTTVMRHSQSLKLLPRLTIRDTRLIADLYRHKIRIVVCFTSQRFVRKDKPDHPDWNVVYVHPFDMLPPFEVDRPDRKGQNRPPAKYTKKACSACANVIQLPATLDVAPCSGCDQPVTVTLGAHNEVSDYSSPIRKRFNITLNGSPFLAAIEVGNARRRQTRDHFVWRVPRPPHTHLELVHSTLLGTSYCKSCIEAQTVTSQPVQEETVSIAELEDMQAAAYVAELDPQPDTDPMIVCSLCQYVDVESKMTKSDTFPSARLKAIAPKHPDACYLCSVCCTSCSDCGALAIRELDSLCDLCYTHRAEGKSVRDQLDNHFDLSAVLR